MLTKMRNKLHIPGARRNIPSIAGLPKLLSGAELAMSSWATRIASYAEIPDIYKSFFEPFSKSDKAFPYTVLTPSQERFIHKQSEKLISTIGHVIYVLERSGSAFKTHCYPIDEISYVEFETALLASSFKICGMTSQGFHTSTTLIFNSITDYLFKPILKRARLITKESEGADQSSELEKFDRLIKVNYKFMSFAKRSLLGGEKVIQYILQPEIRESMLTFLRKPYYRTISPIHMCILTERELIVIQESAAQRKEDRYGGIWNYIPVDQIKSLSVSKKTDNLLVLTLQLPQNTFFEFLFQVSAKEEINRLLGRYRELTIG